MLVTEKRKERKRQQCVCVTLFNTQGQEKVLVYSRLFPCS